MNDILLMIREELRDINLNLMNLSQNLSEFVEYYKEAVKSVPEILLDTTYNTPVKETPSELSSIVDSLIENYHKRAGETFQDE
jgi:hypothetical protein